MERHVVVKLLKRVEMRVMESACGRTVLFPPFFLEVSELCFWKREVTSNGPFIY